MAKREIALIFGVDITIGDITSLGPIIGTVNIGVFP